MKKRFFLSFLLFLLLSLMLVSCKKKVGTAEDNAQVTEDEEESVREVHKIGLSMIDLSNPYFDTLRKAVNDQLDTTQFELIVKDPASDADLQAVQIREMIESGIEAIILSPVDRERITASLEELKEAGIYIINVDTQVMAIEDVDAYIGSDNYQAGVLCGEALVSACPEGGKIVILESPTQNSVNDRITGFEEVLSAAEKGFEIVAREDGKGEFDIAFEICSRILGEQKEITAIMCGNDQMAVAAKTAANLANRKDVRIYSIDGSPDIKKEIAKPDNQIAATVAQSPIRIGKDAMDTLVKVMRGEEYEKEILEDVFLVDPDNVEMYGTDGWQ